MFRKRTVVVAPGQEGVESYTGKEQARGRYSPPNRIYWPGALLGTLVGASYPAYYVGKLILEAHPTQPAWNVLIDQGYVYLVVAAAVVPAFTAAKVFELLLGLSSRSTIAEGRAAPRQDPDGCSWQPTSNFL